MSAPGASPLPPPAHGGEGGLGNALLAVQIVFIIIASLFVSLRIYTRTKILHDLGLDDLFIVLALVAITLAANQNLNLDMSRYSHGWSQPSYLCRCITVLENTPSMSHCQTNSRV